MCWFRIGTFKAGVHLKAALLLGIMIVTHGKYISRSRFKQSEISLIMPHIYFSGCFVNLDGDDFVFFRINEIYGKGEILKI